MEPADSERAGGDSNRSPRRIATVLVGSGLLIAAMAAVAQLTSSPFVFPSLGPTALMIIAQPRNPSARPSTIAAGHAIGIVMGYLALLCTGLQEAPAALPDSVDGARIIAVSLSLATTGAAMIALRRFHAPAGATTLIISLGLITAPIDLSIVLLAVLTLAAIAAALEAAFRTFHSNPDRMVVSKE